MTASTSSEQTLDTVDDELAAALGSALAEQWRTDRGPQRPTIRIERAEDHILAAVLCTRRPATAATTIAHVWHAPGIAGAEAALERLIGEVITDAEQHGDVAVKWQSSDDAHSPERLGFTPMRPPYRSAAGTEGVTGHIRWLRPVTHEQPPYYAQTSSFTCGAVTALLAQEIRGSQGFGADESNRDHEVDFWRRASNYPACEPIGLAVALRESLADAAGTAPVDVFLDTEDPVLLEPYPDGFDRAFREELQANSLRKALGSDIPVRRERIPVETLAARLQAGELALLLLNTEAMYGFAVPHWVLPTPRPTRWSSWPTRGSPRTGARPGWTPPNCRSPPRSWTACSPGARMATAAWCSSAGPNRWCRSARRHARGAGRWAARAACRSAGPRSRGFRDRRRPAPAPR